MTASPKGAAERSRRSWTVLELLRWTTGHFAARGIETARLDAECLLAAALGVERLRLYVDFEKPVAPQERAAFRTLVRRRADERVPVSQLLGQREFWSLPLDVTSEVLSPRPETELLVQIALEQLPDPDAACSILDVGTGAGPIALALASERPQGKITATDTSLAALQIARRNADKFGMAERIEFLEGSGFEPVRGRRFDLVASNPPYLALRARAALPPELAHEPEAALFAGPEGLDVLRELAAGAADVVAPGGALLLEVAPAQAPLVAEACRAGGAGAVAVHRDLAGRRRVVAATGFGEGG